MENVKQLSNLSIFELRDLARKVGVYSPTLLKKTELISQIQAIFDGRIAPHVAKTKQGRPAKSISGYDNIVNVFLPENMHDLETKEERSFIGTMATQAVFEQEQAEFDSTNDNISHGFLEILSNQNGLLRHNIAKDTTINSLVYVSVQAINNHQLKAGDEIVCNSKFLSLDKPMVLTKVISVNGISVDNIADKRPDFDNLKFEMPSKNIILSNLNDEFNELQNKFEIKFGNTIMLYTSNIKDSIKTILAIMNRVQNFNQGIKQIYLNTNITAKDIQNFRCVIGTELFCADFCENFQTQQKMAFLALNRAKRLCESGNDVVLYVDDVYGLAKLNDVMHTGEMYVAKHVLSCAKQTEKGSITIFAILPKTSTTTLQEQVVDTFNRLEDIALYTNHDETKYFELDKCRK